MASRKAYDAIIIGGGVLGNSCAFEFARAGRRTLSIDPNPNAGYGSTSSSSSIIRVFYSGLESCKLAWEGYWGWTDWRDHLEAPPDDQIAVYRPTGGLILKGRGPDPYMERVRAAMENLQIEHSLWDQSELQRRLPFLSLESYHPPCRIDHDRFGEPNGHQLTGGLYTPHTGYMDDPQLAARNLSDAAQRHGGEFLWRSMVASLTYNSAGTAVTGVRLADGALFEAPVVVNAAGPHSSVLHKMAFGGAQVPDDSLVRSRPLRVEVAVLPAPSDVLDTTMPWIADNDLGIYYRPHHPGQILIGGSEPECDPKHFLETPEQMAESLSEEWTNVVYRGALRLPELGIPNSARGLAALYDASDDWLPIYDKSSLGGYFCCFGSSGNQFKNAPVVGKVLHEVVAACERGDDHDARAVQLALPRIGEHLDCGAFSRLRRSADTSGTVFG